MSTDERVAAAAEKAYSRGAYPHVVNSRPTIDKVSTLTAFAEALSFPDYFGHNLDALYDCLTDLSWLPRGEHVLIWPGSDVLRRADPKTYLAVRSVLSDAQRALGPTGQSAGSWRLTVVLPDA